MYLLLTSALFIHALRRTCSLLSHKYRTRKKFGLGLSLVIFLLFSMMCRMRVTQVHKIFSDEGLGCVTWAPGLPSAFQRQMTLPLQVCVCTIQRTEERWRYQCKCLCTGCQGVSWGLQGFFGFIIIQIKRSFSKYRRVVELRVTRVFGYGMSRIWTFHEKGVNVCGGRKFLP